VPGPSCRRALIVVSSPPMPGSARTSQPPALLQPHASSLRIHPCFMALSPVRLAKLGGC